MNMLSFYGGPAGKDFTIAETFDSKFSLDKDIAAGDASKVRVGDYVLVSYGDPDSPTFSDNKQKDGNKSYNDKGLYVYLLYPRSHKAYNH